MVYLYYMPCLRDTILVGNPRILLLFSNMVGGGGGEGGGVGIIHLLIHLCTGSLIAYFFFT